jgi:hypothetical protein
MSQRWNFSLQFSREKPGQKGEIVMKKAKSMDVAKAQELIERLRIEKVQNMEKWEQCGVKDGTEDAEYFDYARFKFFEGVDELVARESNLSIADAICDDEAVKDRIADDELGQEPGFDVEAYCEGYLKGVISVWDEVKHKI